MSDLQSTLPLLPPHRNQQLFADHYLDSILPTLPDWQALREESAQALTQIQAIRTRFRPSTVEAQTEDELIKPILALLGHSIEVQAPLATPGGTKKPDYIFYADESSRAANKGRVLTEALLRGALAVGDAKYWDRPLDVQLTNRSGQKLDPTNPAFQISFYLQHSGVPWGILTNGRLWRLYQRDSAYKLDRFYEVDLDDLLQRNDPTAFLYFYAFFRRAAFAEGPLGLTTLLRASTEYARQISDNLRDQVYDALHHVAQGFLDYAPNRLTTDPTSLAAIYDHSLIVLYRLLFVLYAEARELLPLRESEAYRLEYSLDAIKREVARRTQFGPALLPTTARLWAKLRDLFQIIDVGSPPLHVATFNGGLFDPQRYPFLEQHSVGDAHLQEALDLLTRVDGAFIDYRDLAERHLGTIYEGLLEFHLTPDSSTPGWTVALVTDRGERHRTGSYYTPDFVVQYIVAATVGPLLRAAVAAATTDAEKVAAVLRVNVLDPATGSGHFPVAVTEYIARFLVDQGLTPTDEGSRPSSAESDLSYWKRRVAQSCVYGVDLNPLAVDLAKLSLWLATVAKDRPLSFLDHHLRCGNALVGARLAEVQPGGSTPKRASRASQKTQQALAAGQLSMLDDDHFRQSMEIAVSSMWLIEHSAGNTVAEVKEQERVYAELRAALTTRYERLADVATAARFGLAMDATLWQGLRQYLSQPEGGFQVPHYATLLDTAQQQARTLRFFHWELAFPEVFFDAHGQPLGEQGGFDAVVGNPPYVRQEQLATYKSYFSQAFADTYAGTADVYVYFVEQGMTLLKQGGRLSYIASNSWLRANYATALRRYLRSQTTVDQLIDLGDNRVFQDAPDVYPAIVVLRKTTPADEQHAQAVTFRRGEGVRDLSAQVTERARAVSIHDQPDSGWQLGDDAVRRLLARLLQHGQPLGDVVGGQMYYGIKTGLNEAFIIDQATRDRLLTEDPGSATLIKPMLRGEDLRPWYQENEGRFIIFTRRGIDIDRYPAIKRHLEQFRTQLEPRPVDWDMRKAWPGRKPGPYKWYEIQDSVDYHAAFEEPKIFWPDIGKFPRFSWDTSAFYLGNTGYILTTGEPWLLGYLASRVAWFLVAHIAIPLGERAGSVRYRLIDQYMRQLPIPTTTESQRSAIGDLAIQITAEAQARYQLHDRTRRRMLRDLGGPNAKLNQKLTAWWELESATFRDEVRKVFKRDIPLRERDEWEEWFTERRAEHQQRTAAIIHMETTLNELVYALFGLSDDDKRLIETSTGYRYGEV